ncbi:MAG: thioredoxin family protein [Bdellovibrionales bacterium]
MSRTAVKDQKQPVELGWNAAGFRLMGTDGKFHTLEEVRGPKGLVVIFMCNHCPYVKAALDRMIRDMKELKSLGIGAAAISSNDADNYPDDSFENMQSLAGQMLLPFPYLYDETQEVARSYDAVSTPEFYGFDAGLNLVYRGRLDAGRNGPPPPGSKRELFEAMKSVAQGGPAPSQQQPAVGCTIKWK